MSMLHIHGFSPAHLKGYISPTASEVQAFIEQRPDAINFDDTTQFKYDFTLKRNHPFNLAARHSFFFHFQRALKQQHWLHVKEFDKRLLTADVVEEVLDERLKSIREAWKKRETPKKETTEEYKHDKRVISRVDSVSQFLL